MSIIALAVGIAIGVKFHEPLRNAYENIKDKFNLNK